MTEFKTVKEFIESNIDLIDENDFEKLYELALIDLSPSDISDVGLLLYSLGINVLEYMEKIPTGFMYKETNIDTWLIPSSIEEIGYDAFTLSRIQHIHIPSNVIIIDTNAFLGCEELTQVTFDEGCESIAYHAFARCGLKMLNLPDSVVVISSRAFEDSALERIKLPKKLTTLKEFTFEGCTELRSVNIPISVSHIAPMAFHNCINLQTINYDGTKDQWNKIRRAYSWQDDSGIRYIDCADGIIDLEKI